MVVRGGDASVSDTPAVAGSPVPQIVGRLGLYATYVAAALFTLVLAGDLDVLVRRPPVVGGLALLVGLGPLAALLLSTLASYINYYGVRDTTSCALVSPRTMTTPRNSSN
jgi:hypothetical protein